MSPPASDRNVTPGGGSRNRAILITVVAIFIASLIAIFVWGDALMPTSKDGELNSRPVDGSSGVKL